MLNIARELLAIDKWNCEDIKAENSVKYFLAAKEDSLLDKVESVFISSESLNSENVKVLPTKPSSWMLLCNNKEDKSELSWLEDWAINNEISLKIFTWHEFRARLLNLHKINDYYKKARDEYRTTEGEDFFYISPSVTNEQEKRTEDLVTVVNRLFTDFDSFILYIFAGYGEGKTSFCRNFVFECKDIETMPRIPLIFFLNDCEAGNLENFLQIRLKEDYGLSLTFNQFLRLCELGFFTILFDALDQISNEFRARKIEKDYEAIIKLLKSKGQVVLTCRDKYYKKILEPVKIPIPKNTQELYLQLKGFNETEVKRFLENEPKLSEILLDTENEHVLKYIYKKPLFLQIIKHNSKQFEELLKQKKLVNQNIREFDLFDMVYKDLKKDELKVLTLKKLQTSAFQSIVADSSLSGMNRSIDFEDWFKRFSAQHDIKEDKIEYIKKDLMKFKLLDTSKLEKSDHIAFRFNVFLEFLIAKFVIKEIQNYGLDITPLKFLKNNPLTLETRQLIVPQLEYDLFAENIKDIIEYTSYKNFQDVFYQGSNSFTLLLDILNDTSWPESEKEKWSIILYNIDFRKTILCEADCREADLTDLNFTHVDFTGTDFSYSCLKNAKIEISNLKDTRFNEKGELITAAFLYNSDKGLEFLAGGTENGTLLIWSRENNFKNPTRTRPHRKKITCIDVTSDGNTIYTGSEDASVSFFTLNNPENREPFPVNIRGICSLKLAGDDNYLILGSQDGNLVISNINEKKNNYNYLGKSAWVSAIALNQYKDVIYAGNTDGELFEITDWKEYPKVNRMLSVEQEIKEIIIVNPDLLLILTANNEVRFFKITDNRLEETNQFIRAQAISFSQENTELFWLKENSFFYRFIGDPKSSQDIQIFCKRQGNSIASSNDGNVVAVCGDFLMIFEKEKSGIYKIRYTEEMFMDCNGFIFNYCKNISAEQAAFFLKRGAVVPPDSYLKDFIDIDNIKIDRIQNRFFCNKCNRDRKWYDLYKFEKSKLICKECK